MLVQHPREGTWAFFDLVTGVLRSYLLWELSVGEYIVWSRVTTWPVRAAIVGLTIWAVYRASKEYGPVDPVQEVTEAIDARRVGAAEPP